MIHGINNDNNINNLLGSQLSEQAEALGATNPISGSNTNPYESNKNYLVDETSISKEAFYLYQRELDIKNFTNMVMQLAPNEERMSELFANGVKDPFERFNTDKLINNKKLLKDLDINFS